ncbi:MAG: hypothetical protein WA151_21460 [Desulfatirhabdiaceae bacterium]
METHMPGGVYLCQVSETISCGACCGLYNVLDNSRDHLQVMLMARTDMLERLPRTIDGIDAYSRWAMAHEDLNHPFSDFHHCRFIGLVGENRSRVGCLLHPLADKNMGQDFRGLSHYGTLACRTYFCPTHEALSSPLKHLVKNAAADWYDYGLMITEHCLLNSFWQQVTQKMPSVQVLNSICVQQNLIRKLMQMKINWPFRNDQILARIHYFFNDRLYIRPEISYQKLGISPSRWDETLRELGSSFQSAEEVHRAETLLDDVIDRYYSGI